MTTVGDASVVTIAPSVEFALKPLITPILPRRCPVKPSFHPEPNPALPHPFTHLTHPPTSSAPLGHRFNFHLIFLAFKYPVTPLAGSKPASFLAYIECLLITVRVSYCCFLAGRLAAPIRSLPPETMQTFLSIRNYSKSVFPKATKYTVRCREM